MVDAVEKVFDEYRDKLEMQHQRMERSLDVPIDMPRPENRIRFTPNGLEVNLRYAVTGEKEPEIDDRITRPLLDVMDEEPQLRSASSPPTSVPSHCAGWSGRESITTLISKSKHKTNSRR
jgi:hypothetical protein